MDLGDLIKQQIERDRHRGFAIDFEDDRSRVDQMMRDLVGLMGEVGEFANLLKKVGLAQNVQGYSGPSLNHAALELREELADATIYLFRLVTILNGDLEQDVLRKIGINDERYRKLEG